MILGVRCSEIIAVMMATWDLNLKISQVEVCWKEKVNSWKKKGALQWTDEVWPSLTHFHLIYGFRSTSRRSFVQGRSADPPNSRPLLLPSGPVCRQELISQHKAESTRAMSTGLFITSSRRRCESEPSGQETGRLRFICSAAPSKEENEVLSVWNAPPGMRGRSAELHEC